MKLSVVAILCSFIVGFQAHAQQDLFGNNNQSAQAVGSTEAAAFRGLLGFTQGAINFGAEYESRKSSIRSVGGYFFYQTERKEGGVIEVPQVMALGGYMPLHLIGKNVIDLYIAPGFGLAMVKVGTDTETGIGPSLKIGAEYRTSATTSWGLQYGTYYNWFSQEAPAGADYASGAVTFLF